MSTTGVRCVTPASICAHFYSDLRVKSISVDALTPTTSRGELPTTQMSSTAMAESRHVSRHSASHRRNSARSRPTARLLSCRRLFGRQQHAGKIQRLRFGRCRRGRPGRTREPPVSRAISTAALFSCPLQAVDVVAHVLSLSHEHSDGQRLCHRKQQGLAMNDVCRAPGFGVRVQIVDQLVPSSSDSTLMSICPTR